LFLVMDDMATREEKILIKARKLDELEKSFLKFTYEEGLPDKENYKEYLRKAVEISAEAFELKNEILFLYHDITNLTIHDPVALKILDKIRNKEKLHSVSFYEGLAKLVNKDVKNWNERWETSIEDFLASSDEDLFDEFHSWFGIYEYYAAKCKIGPIISSFHIPESMIDYFEEIRETFAFGQYRASIALSRALLEMALFDKLNRKRAFKNRPSKVVSIDVAKEDNLYTYINLAKFHKIIDSERRDLAHSIRQKANAVLHIKDKASRPSQKETFEIIFETITLIEFLYRG